MSENILDKLDREGIRLASTKKRAMSYLIDELLISVLFTVIYWGKFAETSSYEEVMNITYSLIPQVVMLKVLYQAFFIWYYGATLGKIAMKIVCVDLALLDKPNLTASIIRSIVRIISENCFFLGFAWALGNQTLQTWHDLAAKTVVIDVY
ncbi:RDD family protein [Campylobacter sp. MOP51]|uniref:RDD family protein n=1 Tax=Campylobacter canis TaxID=3378588 RepID=UPI003C4D6930